MVEAKGYWWWESSPDLALQITVKNKHKKNGTKSPTQKETRKKWKQDQREPKGSLTSLFLGQKLIVPPFRLLREREAEAKNVQSGPSVTSLGSWTCRWKNCWVHTVWTTIKQTGVDGTQDEPIELQVARKINTYAVKNGEPEPGILVVSGNKDTSKGT